MMPRVGILTYGLDRPPTGIGRYAIELLRALAALAPESPPTLLTPAPPRYLPQAEGYPQRPLVFSRRLPALLTLGSLQLPRRARGLHLLHDPTGNPPFLFLPPSIRLVVTIHDLFALAHPQTSTLLEKLIARFWLPLVLPKVDRILTDSQASKADLLRYLPLRERQITVIPCGVGPEFRPLPAGQVAATLARYGLTPGYLLTVVGAQDARRNLARLLAAYRLLRRQREMPPLVIIGKPRRSAWENKERQLPASGEEGVQFLGYVPQDDLPAFYNGASVFAFPSLYEGFGMPPLEAMACGAPVACSNVSAIPEVVGEAALLFDPYDVEAIASAISHLLEDAALRAELRERGLRRAMQFTWERAARATLAIYQELCDSP